MEGLLESFKKLALDDLSYSSLLKDNTSLGGLVILLSNEKESAVEEILNIFKILSERNGGSYYLSKLPGMMEQLSSLKASGESHSVRIRELTDDLFETLFSSKAHLKRMPSQSHRPKKSRKSRPVVIQLSGNITKQDLKAIESQLITVKGVVSITFQLNKLRVVVMALDDLDPERILEAVSVACKLASATNDRSDISAHVVKRQKSKLSRVSSMYTVRDRRSFAPSSAAAAAPKVSKPLHPYLADTADIFEVDPSRGAPQVKGMAGANSGRSRGFTGWLSDLIESTIFW
ncbi:unnamed protein product [Mesocestoides corti]|uniref:HMA domain-containing protein n=2 Tax=Mesocestoides corti TaxID=53468 RepID=A0A0R3UPQ8_MESCO|nr:unnamed protein product [Mesocestoides corti]